MHRVRVTHIIQIGIVASAVACTSSSTRLTGLVTPTVIMISLDGFRWDFRQLGDTPVLDSLASTGVTAERMIPSFPSLTFPSHYTMATGLYPERHGIISNTMFDPSRMAWFRISDRRAVEDPLWWGGEPIWLTAERQGRMAATFFWPGTETAILGSRATYWYRFDPSIANARRVDQVLEWLALPAAEQPQLITLYIPDVDQAAHDLAPDHPRLRQAIEGVDRALARLTDGLARMGVNDRVHLIVVSDHGMARQSPDRVIFMDDYIDVDRANVINWSPVWMARPSPEDVDMIGTAIIGAHPHLSAYVKDDIPDRYHFKDNDRVPPIIAVADEGWSITTREYYARNPNGFDGHTHGYDNGVESMGSLFIASGPAFVQGAVVPPFENVHIYALVCHVLGIVPAPNDGNLDAVMHLLR